MTPGGFIHKHFIFFTTYKWVQEARVFGPGKLFQPNVSNTLASYTHLLFTKEIKCYEYDSWGYIHKHFIFFVTYKRAQEARVFGPGKLFQPNVSNTLAYLAQL
jgi:hypothetical protein